MALQQEPDVSQSMWQSIYANGIAYSKYQVKNNEAMDLLNSATLELSISDRLDCGKFSKMRQHFWLKN